MKQTKFSRILSWVLTICMVVSLMPGMALIASAAAGPTDLTELKKAIEAAPTGGTETTITLNGAINLTGDQIVIPAGKNIVLELNAFAIYGTAKDSTAIVNNGTLTIKNSKDSGAGIKDENDIGLYNLGTAIIESGQINGKVEGIRNGNPEISAVDTNKTNVTLTVNGGSIKGGTQYGIGNYYGSTVTINGGEIEGATGLASTGPVTIKDGNIVATTAYGIHTGLGANGALTMSGGSVSGVSGGLLNETTANITGGTLSTSNGYVLENKADTSATMTVGDAVVLKSKDRTQWINDNSILNGRILDITGPASTWYTAQLVEEGITLSQGVATFIDVPTQNTTVRYDLLFCAAPANSAQPTGGTNQDIPSGFEKLALAKIAWDRSETSDGVTKLSPASANGANSASLLFKATLDLKKLKPHTESADSFNNLSSATPELWVRINPCTKQSSEWNDVSWVKIGTYNSWNQAAGYPSVITSQEELELVLNAGISPIVLGANFTISKMIEIPQNKTFVLDLKGHTITRNTSGHAIHVNGSSTLTIIDSTATDGISDGGIVSTGGSNAALSSNGTLTIEAGTYKGTEYGLLTSGSGTTTINNGAFTATNSKSYGVYVNSGANLTIMGGQFSGYTCAAYKYDTSSKTPIDVQGGSYKNLSNNTPEQDALLHNATLPEGKSLVAGNDGWYTLSANASTSSFDLSTYTGKWTYYGANSSDHWNTDSESFPKVNGSSIDLMTDASQQASAIWTDAMTLGDNFSLKASVTLTHTSQNAVGDGFAILLGQTPYLGFGGGYMGFRYDANYESNGLNTEVLKLNGAEAIQTALGKTYGAYVDVYGNKIGAVNAGTISSSSYTGSKTGTFYVWMDYDKTSQKLITAISTTDDYNSAAKQTVTDVDFSGGQFYLGFTAGNGDASLGVTVNSCTLTPYDDKSNSASVGTFDKLKEAIANGATNITLTADIDVSETLAISNNVTINGDGHTMKRANDFKGTLVNVTTGGDLTLNNVIIDGGAVWTAEDGENAMPVNTGVTPALINNGKAGGVVASATEGGGGQLIFVNGGTLNLGAGTILQNNDRRPEGSDTSYAPISDEGSAVYVLSGVLNMNDDVTIKNNRVADPSKSVNNGDGAAISIQNCTSAVISGTITGNYSGRMGGAIRVFKGNEGSVTIQNATITNNYISNSAQGAVAIGMAVTVSGKVVIENNYYAAVGTDTTDCKVDVIFDNEGKLNKGSIELTSGSTIGIIGAAGTVIGTDFESADAAYFFADDDTLEVIFKDEDGSLILSNAAVNVFIENHLTAADGSVITDATADNYAQILGAEAAWNALSDDEKAAVNTKLTAANDGTSLTYDKLLADAKELDAAAKLAEAQATAKNAIDQAATAKKAAIDAMTDLTEDQKTAAKNAVTAAQTDALTKINAATTAADANLEAAKAIAKMEVEVIAAGRINDINAMTGDGELTADDQTALIAQVDAAKAAALTAIGSAGDDDGCGLAVEKMAAKAAINEAAADAYAAINGNDGITDKAAVKTTINGLVTTHSGNIEADATSGDVKAEKLAGIEAIKKAAAYAAVDAMGLNEDDTTALKAKIDAILAETKTNVNSAANDDAAALEQAKGDAKLDALLDAEALKAAINARTDLTANDKTALIGKVDTALAAAIGTYTSGTPGTYTNAAIDNAADADALALVMAKLEAKEALIKAEADACGDINGLSNLNDTQKTTLKTNVGTKTDSGISAIDPAADAAAVKTAKEEGVADIFVAAYLTGTDGNVYTSGNSSNYRQIKAGSDNWSALNADEQAKVNAILTVANNNNSLTYPDLRAQANQYPIYIPSTGATVAPVANGTITVDKPTASAGQTVTITTTPDEGYELGTLTVTDSKGNPVTLKDLGNGKYSFTMPSNRPVTIKGTFVAIEDCDGGVNCPSAKFIDVDTTQWYHEAVDYVIVNGLMKGTGTTTFEPLSTTSRGMIVTILYRLEGEPSTYGLDNPFTDLTQDWYVDAVKWAAANGIVEGYGNGNYGPNDPITREQMATILWRYAKYKGVDVSSGETMNITGYADDETISAYALPAMKWAVAEGIIGGYNGYLTPADSATRGQVAAILHRYCLLIEE